MSEDGTDKVKVQIGSADPVTLESGTHILLIPDGTSMLRVTVRPSLGGAGSSAPTPNSAVTGGASSQPASIGTYHDGRQIASQVGWGIGGSTGGCTVVRNGDGTTEEIHDKSTQWIGKRPD